MVLIFIPINNEVKNVNTIGTIVIASKNINFSSWYFIFILNFETATKSRIKNLVNNAKFLLDGLPEHEDEWLGFRPTLPDYLPVIGPSKNYKNIFYSFGHHHLGWTLGAISGKIISKMISEEKTNLDLDPYSSLRFS